jgi:gluconolactonase
MERLGRIASHRSSGSTSRQGASRRCTKKCGRHRLKAPNDLVFGRDGSLWFTDLGRVHNRTIDRGGVYWCRPDGSEIREVIFPLDQPNGIGLSPDGGRVYVSETNTGRLWGWDIKGPGDVVSRRRPATAGSAVLLADPGHLTRFDSLAVDGDGWVCVARLGDGAILSVPPSGQDCGIDVIAMPDRYTTNICFGPDGTTAFATLSSTGRLAAFDWPRPGGRTAFSA